MGLSRIRKLLAQYRQHNLNMPLVLLSRLAEYGHVINKHNCKLKQIVSRVQAAISIQLRGKYWGGPGLGEAVDWSSRRNDLSTFH